MVVTAAALVVVGFGVAALDPTFSAGKPSAVASSTLIAVGTSEQPRPTPTIPISASPSRSAVPSPTASIRSATPSPAPTRAPGFVSSGDSSYYLTADGSRIPVVPVTGLAIQIQNGRAVYYANSGNKYGLKTGSYAGEFLPLVTMGQPDGSSAQTGAAVLAGPVANKLTTDALAHITDAANRWLVVLPLDIRAARGSFVDVSFDDFGLSGIANTPRVLIRFPGVLPLVEAVPSNGGVHVLVEGINVTRWQVIDPIRLNLSPNKIDATKAMNQLIVYGDGTPSLQFDQFIDGHLGMGSQVMDVSGDVSVSLAVTGSHSDIGPQNVLQIAGVPVFVASAS
jgi:hypothetical protein